MFSVFVPSVKRAAGFGLTLVDEVDDVEESPLGPIMDTSPGDADGQMRLAGSGATDEHDVALLGVERSGGQLIHPSNMQASCPTPGCRGVPSSALSRAVVGRVGRAPGTTYNKFPRECPPRSGCDPTR